MIWRTTSTVTLTLLFASSVCAQLRITEVMYDSVNDSNWEWFEVTNTGAADFDLDGYYVDDTGGTAIDEMDPPNILNVANGGQSMNTVIPAGKTAVLYDGDALAYDDSRFRAAWNLGADIPLIGVDSFPGLNNSDDQFGLWAAFPQYSLDTGDGDDDGDLEVLQFTNATAFLGYGGDTGFPDAQNASIAWNGMGDYQDGAQWFISEDGMANAKTSLQTFLPGLEPLNDPTDIGNPGKLPDSGAAPTGLHFTEIMYNPASDDSEWEWVEVLNATGFKIDFTATPHVFDDEGGGPLTEPNVTTGAIEDGQVAVLFNAEITIENMKAAWGADVNFIPVENWSALNNGGDQFAIWSGLGPDYEGDKADDIFDAAVAALEYADDGDWPADNGDGSIFLSSLGLEGSVGTSWQLSAPDDGISVNPQQLFAGGAPEDHPGGDVGSPGVGPGEVIVNPPTGSVDFNGDSNVDCTDIDLLYTEIASGANTAAFDLNSDGAVNDDDVPAFLSAAGEALGLQGPVPDGDANLDGIVDANDLNVLGLRWQQDATSWCQGDFNRDGTINASDLNDVGQNWLTDVTGGQQALSQAAHSQAVPEPNAITLLVFAVVGLGLRRRH